MDGKVSELKYAKRVILIEPSQYLGFCSALQM